MARISGRPTIIYNDQLEMIGSRRIYLPGMSELHTLGLLDVERFSKCHACRLSDRWRNVHQENDEAGGDT